MMSLSEIKKHLINLSPSHQGTGVSQSVSQSVARPLSGWFPPGSYRFRSIWYESMESQEKEEQPQWRGRERDRKTESEREKVSER